MAATVRIAKVKGYIVAPPVGASVYLSQIAVFTAAPGPVGAKVYIASVNSRGGLANQAPTATVQSDTAVADAGQTVTHTAYPVDVDGTVERHDWRVVSVSGGAVAPTLIADTVHCSWVAPASATGGVVRIGYTPTDDDGTVGVEATVDITVYAATRYVTRSGPTYGPTAQFVVRPDPPVTPVPPVVTTPPNTVTIGPATHVLDGINPQSTIDAPGGRGANQLVQFTLASPTTTNQYGVEVVVTKATGVVVSVNDRITTDSTTGTSFTPATQYVLSGHGTGAGYAGQWLRDNAYVGATIALSNVTVPVTPPVVIPPPVPGGSGTGNKLIVWHHAYEGPQPFTAYPTAVQAAVDQINLIPSTSAGAGTGSLTYPNRFGAGLASSIAAAKANGVDVLMGVGGAGDGGITVLNSTQAGQMVASIKGFVNSYGIVGIDFDLEDVSKWNATSLASVANQLKAFYGPSFLVGITAGYYSPQDTQYKALAAAIGANLDNFSLMEYDYPQASTAGTYAGIIVSKIADLISAGVPLAKITWGMAVRDPAAPSYTGYSPSVAFLQTEWDTVHATYPGLKRGFIWEDKISAARSTPWDWVTGMTSRIHA